MCAEKRGGVRAPRNELGAFALQQEKPPSGGLILLTITEVVNGHADSVPQCPLSGAKQKTCARIELFRFDPFETSHVLV